MSRKEQFSVYGTTGTKPNLLLSDDTFVRSIDVLDASFFGNFIEKPFVLFSWTSGNTFNSGGQNEIPLRVNLAANATVLSVDPNKPINVFYSKATTTKNTWKTPRFIIKDPNTNEELIYSDYFIRFRAEYDDNMYYHETNTRPDFAARHLHV
jgi:hypothetical protein